MNRFCRICLATNVEMCPFSNRDERMFIATIFLQHGFHGLHENHYACYICRALLSKFYQFVKRALRAQETHHELMKKYGLVTVNTLQDVDRIKQNIHYSNLTFVKIEMDSHKPDSISIKNDKNDGCVDVITNLKYEFISANKGDEKGNDDIIFNRSGFENESDSNDRHVTSEYCLDLDTNPLAIEDDSVNDITEASDPFSLIKPIGSTLVENLTDTECCIITKSKSQELKNSMAKLERKKRKKGKRNKKKVNRNNAFYSEIPVVIENEIVVPLPLNLPIPEYETDNDSDDVKIVEKTGRYRRKTRKDEEGSYRLLTISPSENSDENCEPDLSKIPYDEEYIPHSSDAMVSDPDDREYPMTCEQCKAEILFKCDHYSHYLEFHPNVKYPYGRTYKYVCDICGHKTGYFAHFKSHQQLHGKKTFKCEQCPKRYGNKPGLLQHVIRVHKPRNFVCDYCDKRLPDKAAVKLHIRTHTGSKPYKCHICNAGFAHGGNRLLHIRVKHQNLPYPLQEKREKQLAARPKKRSKRTTSSDDSDSLALIRSRKNIKKRKLKSRKKRSTMD